MDEKKLVTPAPLPTGMVVDRNGVVVGRPEVAGLKFSTHEPEPDDAVYQIAAAYPGPKKIGLEFKLKAGWMMYTFQIEGSKEQHDSGLVFSRTMTPPPAGTRFVVRMLPPRVGEASKYFKMKIDDERTPEQQSIVDLDSKLRILAERIKLADEIEPDGESARLMLRSLVDDLLGVIAGDVAERDTRRGDVLLAYLNAMDRRA